MPGNAAVPSYISKLQALVAQGMLGAVETREGPFPCDLLKDDRSFEYNK